MPEPISLTLVGATVLTEGIKFLYGQASEALKRWREHKAAAPSPAEVPVAATVPDVFAGALQPLQLHLDAMPTLEPELRQLRDAFTDYGPDFTDVTPANPALLEQTDALRRLMEALYQQRLTFKGEARPPSGPLVEGKIDVGEVAGYAAAVRIRVAEAGTIRGEANADRVTENGTLIGVEIDTVR